MKNKMPQFRAFSKSTGMIELVENRTLILQYNKISGWNIYPAVADYKGPYTAGQSNSNTPDFTLIEFTGFQDITPIDLYDGDIVTYTDFRGIYTKEQSKHDGYIPGWIGIIRWSDHNGWYLDKNNTHNQKMLQPLENEREYRSNSYHYRMDHIARVRPMKIGNMYENIDLLTSFDYNTIKQKYEQAIKMVK